MRRITTIFEERLIAQLKASLSEAEQGEIDYELGPAPYPNPQPDGTMGVNLGMSVTLVVRAATLNDHIAVTGLIQDMYAPDELLKTNVEELLAEMRSRRSRSLSVSNGGLIVPGGLPS